MKRILLLIGFLASFAASAQTVAYYRIDLVPTGTMLSKDVPVFKGGAYVFHSYPAGTLMSMRRSEVKLVTPVTPEAAPAADPTGRVVQIGNLAMQGGSTQAGPTNASAVRPRGAAARTGPELGEGFYSNVIPGETQAFPNSPNDYQIGRTYAAPPSSAVQSSPGAPPTMTSATNGSNPPQ
jgi:hypothetical protein